MEMEMNMLLEEKKKWEEEKNIEVGEDFFWSIACLIFSKQMM
jgi:hypothetical protein